MTKTREMDAFSASVYGDREQVPRAERWRRWRRTGLPVVAVILVIVAVAVVSDLPTRQSLAGERTQATSLIQEVNRDLKPCAYALREGTTVFPLRNSPKVSSADRSRIPSLLADEAAACSFTSDNINDLADIEEPGTGAGKYLALVVGESLSWTTSDALASIDDMILLVEHRHAPAAARDLLRRSGSLASDRRQAITALRDAEHYLKGSLPSLDMPSVSLPRP